MSHCSPRNRVTPTPRVHCAALCGVAPVRYTKHSSRFLTFWCSSLPLALFPVVGPTGTVPVTMVLSYMFLGIEEIGSRCEEPFSVLPLWQYCQAVDKSCAQLLLQDYRQEWGQRSDGV